MARETENNIFQLRMNEFIASKMAARNIATLNKSHSNVNATVIQIVNVWKCLTAIVHECVFCVQREI